MDDLYLFGLVGALLADAYLGDSLPYLELELFNLLLQHLRLVYEVLVLLGDSLGVMLVAVLQRLHLLREVLLQLVERHLQFSLQDQGILLAVPHAVLDALQILAQDFLEQQVVLVDVLGGVFERQDFVDFVPKVAVGAVDAEHLAFGEAVESEDVVVLHASKLVAAALHQVEQVDAGAQFLLLEAQLVFLALHLLREVVSLYVSRLHVSLLLSSVLRRGNLLALLLGRLIRLI